jgi:hypothetical protein
MMPPAQTDLLFRAASRLSRSSSSLSSLAFVFLAPLLAEAQQPNHAVGMFVQFRSGPPYPIAADAPNSGSLGVILYGPPSAPFMILTGALNPNAISLPSNQSLDVGTPPAFGDLQVLADGVSAPFPQFAISAVGITGLSVSVAPNVTLPVPPLQAAVIDPFSPIGFSMTAASAVTLQPAKSVLFLQGDHDPGLGTGPHCRLADPSPYGFAALASLLVTVGFSQATEVVDTAVTVSPQLLAPHGVVVVGSNQKAWTTPEVDAIESFVRAGGGLVPYSDSMFGPGSVASDNQVLGRFGLLTTPDNFGGPVLATSFVPHPISAGLPFGVKGEGVSILEIVGNGTDVVTNVVPCLSNNGACFPYPFVAPSGASNPVYSACAAVDASLGRVVATFDRNTFFNFPGTGTNITEASNASYAINLFLWAGGY